MLKSFFIIVKIVTIIGMVALPIALWIMCKERNSAMLRAKNDEEAMAIAQSYTKKFYLKFLLFIIPAFILNIISTFY